jgi:hypothetical protein
VASFCLFVCGVGRSPQHLGMCVLRLEKMWRHFIGRQRRTFLVHVSPVCPSVLIGKRAAALTVLLACMSAGRTRSSCCPRFAAQDKLYEPVALGCGHRFCKDCLLDALGLSYSRGGFHALMSRAPFGSCCPQCRQRRVFEDAMELRELGDYIKARCRQRAVKAEKACSSTRQNSQCGNGTPQCSLSNCCWPASQTARQTGQEWHPTLAIELLSPVSQPASQDRNDTQFY